ncbi:MAG: hypothetical protein AAFR04_02055 [Pseudomonadota bacterium]
MFKRCAILALAAFALCGCANSATRINAIMSANAAEAPPTTTGVTDEELTRKTLASKMLAAIALERVTGAKPDPSRLAEVY